MRRSICGPILLLLLLASAIPALAIPGATDRVPAATLLVPFFETGINSTTQPHDTLLAVTNWLFANITLHYHVWTSTGARPPSRATSPSPLSSPGASRCAT